MRGTPDNPLDAPFKIGSVEIPNRVVLAPLAGIGNWFVRLQARRFGAGLVVSEMVSSFGIYYGNRRTMDELMRIHPDEHPVSVQLFGCDAKVMGRAAEKVSEAGADIIDINMGCPVKKVRKTGAGAALLGDHETAIEIAKATVSGGGLPVTVKLRSGRYEGSDEGMRLSHRLVEEAGVSAIAIHPRPAGSKNDGNLNYQLARDLCDQLPVPVMVSGGVKTAEKAREIYQMTGATAVMIARGCLGNPWIFSEVLGIGRAPTRMDVISEMRWTIAAAEEHLGAERACRYMRKFYPWYIKKLGLPRKTVDRLVLAATLDEVQTELERIESDGVEPVLAA